MIKIMKKTQEMEGAFLPFVHSDLEQQLLDSGALRYGARRYGTEAWLDNEGSPVGLDTIINLNTVLACKKSEKTKSGWSVWDCTDQVTVTDDGVILTDVMPVVAELIDKELPVFIYGENVSKVPGGWCVITKDGHRQNARSGGGYWLYVGAGNVSVLDLKNPEFSEYYVLNEQGDYGQTLEEYHQHSVHAITGTRLPRIAEEAEE